MLRSAKDNIAAAPESAVTSQKTPPVSLEPCSVNIQAPASRDYQAAIKAIFAGQHVDKIEEDFAKITDYLFGDTNQALIKIKNETLADCKTKVTAFIHELPTTDQDPQITSYRTAACQSLANNLQSQEHGIDCTIASELKALASDDLLITLTNIIKRYLEFKHKTLIVYLGLGAALYKSAVDYYYDRWKISHDDPVKLKQECDAFNLIFKGIIQINPDYSLTPLKDIGDALFRKTPAGIEDLLNGILKRAAYNKLDINKSSYALILNQLNVFTNHEKNTTGEYFKPLDCNEKKHAIYFHNDVYVMFDNYMKSRSAFEGIAAKSIDAATGIHTQLRSRVIEFTKSVAEITLTELAAANENIQHYQEFLRDELQIEESNKTLQQKLATTHQILRDVKLPLQKIRQIGLPRPIMMAVTMSYAQGELGEKCKDLFSTFKDLQKRTIEQKKKLHQLKLDFLDAKVTLQVVNTSEHIQAIHYEHKQIKHELAQLDNDIADTSHELRQISAFLEQVHTAKSTIDSAIQYYQDLIDGKIHDDYFAEEGGGHQPFDAALKKIISLKERKPYAKLPDDLKKYFDDSEQELTQTQNDLTAILRCHILFNSILNFGYWRFTADRTVTIHTNNQRYRIPRSIFLLIKLAKRPEYQNWTSDPLAASHLLESMQALAANTKCRSPALKQFMGMITHHPEVLIPEANNHNPLSQMFMRPLRLVSPDDINQVQKSPPIWKRHPILMKALVGTGIGLLAFAAAAVIAGLIMSGIGTLPALILLVGGASAAWGIASGALVASGGIGFGIGAIIGKLQFMRNKKQLANVEADIAHRPAPPAYQPVQPEAEAARPPSQPVRVSSSKNGMFRQQDQHKSQKTEFDFFVVNTIIDVYSGKENETNPSPVTRIALTKLWHDSKYSLDKFFTALENQRPASAGNIIKDAVDKGADLYPYAINKYPATSALRNRYCPPPAARARPSQ